MINIFQHFGSIILWNYHYLLESDFSFCPHSHFMCVWNKHPLPQKRIQVFVRSFTKVASLINARVSLVCSLFYPHKENLFMLIRPWSIYISIRQEPDSSSFQGWLEFHHCQTAFWSSLMELSMDNLLSTNSFQMWESLRYLRINSHLLTIKYTFFIHFDPMESSFFSYITILHKFLTLDTSQQF